VSSRSFASDAGRLSTISVAMRPARRSGDARRVGTAQHDTTLARYGTVAHRQRYILVLTYSCEVGSEERTVCSKVENSGEGVVEQMNTKYLFSLHFHMLFA